MVKTHNNEDGSMTIVVNSQGKQRGMRRMGSGEKGFYSLWIYEDDGYSPSIIQEDKEDKVIKYVCRFILKD
jgi:hypothetical protein